VACVHLAQVGLAGELGVLGADGHGLPLRTVFKSTSPIEDEEALLRVIRGALRTAAALHHGEVDMFGGGGHAALVSKRRPLVFT
jgi:hypothetical protein